MIDPRHFRNVLGSYPTGVCVITSVDADGNRLGLVIGSFVSISLDPPLVGFFPDKRSGTWPRIEASGRFCVNVLGSDQLALCQRFAARGEDKFAELAHGHAPSGLPLLDDPYPDHPFFRAISPQLGRPGVLVARLFHLIFRDEIDTSLIVAARRWWYAQWHVCMRYLCCKKSRHLRGAG